MKIYEITAYNGMPNGGLHVQHEILLKAPAALEARIDRYIVQGNYYGLDFNHMKDCTDEDRKEFAALKFEGDLVDNALREGVSRLMCWTFPNTCIVQVTEAADEGKAVFYRD